MAAAPIKAGATVWMGATLPDSEALASAAPPPAALELSGDIVSKNDTILARGGTTHRHHCHLLC